MSFAMDYESMKEELKKRLKPTRFQHSLGVAETALFLAKRFHVDEEKAHVAGLLHDCAREFRNDEMIAEAKKRGLPIDALEREMPLLLHGPIGARRIREIYGVDDPEIEQAIARHTVGGGHMTDLDKIIWFADMIEPNRAYPGVEKLRKMAREASLDEMLLEGLSDSICFVIAKRHMIHPDTVTARNEILLKMKKDA